MAGHDCFWMRRGVDPQERELEVGNQKCTHCHTIDARDGENCRHCQPSVECVTVNMHVFCVALALVPVGCQHVHYTDTMTVVSCERFMNSGILAAYGGSAQAISAQGVHLNTFHFALSSPVTHVIMERHLDGTPRDGLHPEIHALDGARGSLVAFIVMNERRCIERFDSDYEGTTRDLGRC